MSDADAVNLWKIRYFQDNMKNLRNLTSPVFLLLAAVAALAGWVACDSAAQTQCRKWLAQVTGTDAPEPEENPENEAEKAEAIAAGNHLVRIARDNLFARTAGLTANVLQIVQTPEKTYRGTGRFLQSADGKSRLEVQMNIDDVSGDVTQIANGQVIWFIQRVTLPPTKKGATEDGEPIGAEERLSIERVDTRRITQHAVNAGMNMEDPRIWREALGGWCGLLASLESDMNFRIIKHTQMQGEEYVVLEGEWKVSWDERNFGSEFVDGVARGAAPDKVRLYLRQRDWLPVRYICLKRKEKGGWFAPLALEMTDLNEQARIDPAEFTFRPGVDQVPNDVTHEYIARVTACVPAAVTNDQAADPAVEENATETR